jgi:hypothetical protein
LPSCSAVEALDRQEPFINQTLASSALAMLARLFRYGKLTHHGGFFNAEPFVEIDDDESAQDPEELDDAA